MSPPRRQTGLAEVRGTLDRVTRVSFVLRFYAVPFMLTAVGVVCVLDGAAWRLAIMIPAWVLGVAWSAADLRRYRATGVSFTSWPVAVAGVTTLQAAIFTVTGGLESPLLPAMIATGGVSGVLLPRGSRAVLALHLSCVAAFVALRLEGIGLLPAAFGGDVHAAYDARRTYSIAAIVAVMSTLINRLGAHFRGALDAGLRRARDAEEEMLAANAEHARGLTTLSAEIAHELKNPLASVKGLAALVSKDVDGRAGERMAVLRQEVDRMQRILEEFLTFSRPLVPLSLETVDVTELARDVTALHEGLLEERGVRVDLVAPTTAIEISGDAKKIRQALVNVLQNAIAAAPPKSEIHVAIERWAESGIDGARLLVRDEGPGLDPAVAMRAFEPGVTTKSDGNGLGLTIARSLARQHGGDIELQSSTSGLEVVLWLPTRPLERAAAEGAAS